jgi:type IV secretory pathway VirB10-like protein
MTSNARVFFAGVGTTFVILAVGFGGGLMLAKSALHDQPPQMRASSEPTTGMRVILPPSAEPAIQVAERPAALEPKPQPVKEVQAPVEQKVEKEDPEKAERDLKAERRRYAERKAKKMAAARARHQVEPRERTEPGIMAFGGDESRMSFGN